MRGRRMASLPNDEGETSFLSTLLTMRRRNVDCLPHDEEKKHGLPTSR
jgi:hypothetical protein